MLDCDWNLVERKAHAKDANDDHVPAVDPHQDGHLPRLVAAGGDGGSTRAGRQ